jgi:DNA polymerase-3 subunit delta'
MPLSTIKGQDKQIEILQNALRENTLAHAYLFTGVSGIGKMTVARALAKILQCKNASDDFCDCCIPCKQITGDTHPDTLIIEPEGNTIKISQIRQLQEQLAFTVYEGNKKVVIFDHADRMTIQAANCLLKTLEEPPPHTILILLTSIPYRVPSTIRSRCQRLMFKPLSETLIVELLQNKLGKKTPPELQLIASLAEGSFGNALRWAENEALSERQTFLEAVNNLDTHSLASIFECASLLGDDKEVVLEKLDMLAVWLRDCAVGKVVNHSHYFINKDLLPLIYTVSSSASWSDLLKKIEVVKETQRAVQENVNIRLAAEALFLRISHEQLPPKQKEG